MSVRLCLIEEVELKVDLCGRGRCERERERECVNDEGTKRQRWGQPSIPCVDLRDNVKSYKEASQFLETIVTL